MRRRFRSAVKPRSRGYHLEKLSSDFLTLVRYKADLYLVLRMRTALELKRGRFLFLTPGSNGRAKNTFRVAPCAHSREPPLINEDWAKSNAPRSGPWLDRC